jgi:hypothetical protein
MLHSLLMLVLAQENHVPAFNDGSIRLWSLD